MLQQRAAHSLLTFEASTPGEMDEPLPADLPLLASENRAMLAPGLLAALAGCSICYEKEDHSEDDPSLAWLPSQLQAIKVGKTSSFLDWEDCPALPAARVFKSCEAESNGSWLNFCRVFPNLEKIQIRIPDWHKDGVQIFMEDIGSISTLRYVQIWLLNGVQIDFSGPAECRVDLTIYPDDLWEGFENFPGFASRMHTLTVYYEESCYA